MFGTNELVGKKYFKDAAQDTLLVTSVFFTLQGEGPYSGLPAVFVRLAKCNLNCSFCFPSHYPITVLGKGSMRMDEVKIGDQIITLDDNLKPTYTTVRASESRWVSVEDMVEVAYKEDDRTRKMIVTKDHPFNVKGKGFVEAGSLKKGQTVHHLPGNERSAHKMAMANPMKNSKLAKAMGKRAREAYANGTQVSYVRDAEWRANQAERMVAKNPMHDNATVKQVTESKTYAKSMLEKSVHQVLRQAGFDVEFTGNKKGWMIGDDEHGYMRPDFAFKGTKKVLEVYDRSYPFYTDERHTPKGERRYKSARRKHYRKFGHSVGFLTPQQLNLRGGNYKRDHVDLGKVQAQVGKFLSNGVTITSVGAPSTASVNAPFTKAGTYKDGKVKVTNFSCDGNNTFCMKGLHTHNCDTYFDSGDWLTFDQLNQKIDEAVIGFFGSEEAVPLHTRRRRMAYGKPYYPHVVLVVTGGEPLLQQELMNYLEEHRHNFRCAQIESNGTVSQDVPVGVTLVCSPKCSEKKGAYLKPTELILERADCLKFVMSGDPASPYHTVPDWVHEWKEMTGKEVYVSPMNIYNTLPRKIKELHAAGPVTMEQRSTVDEVVSFWEEGVLNLEQNRINHEYAARYAMQHGFRMQLQVHLFASLA